MKTGYQFAVLPGDSNLMLQGHPLGRPLVAIAFYNNGESARLLLERLPRWPDVDIVFHDDGSTDGTFETLSQSGYPVLRSEVNSGIGSSIKRIIRYAHETQHKVVVLMAGNNKDDPTEISSLLLPIYHDGYDYVQGSRRLQGGASPSLPLFRRLMVPIHAFVMSCFTGFWCTDALNGFRAYKIGMLFEDKRFNIWQDWLNHYEIEAYIHYNVLRNGYRVIEVPVTKSYSHFAKGMKLTHIRPFLDWWGIISPLILLRLGLRK